MTWRPTNPNLRTRPGRTQQMDSSNLACDWTQRTHDLAADEPEPVDSAWPNPTDGLVEYSRRLDSANPSGSESSNIPQGQIACSRFEVMFFCCFCSCRHLVEANTKECSTPSQQGGPLILATVETQGQRALPKDRPSVFKGLAPAFETSSTTKRVALHTGGYELPISAKWIER